MYEETVVWQIRSEQMAILRRENLRSRLYSHAREAAPKVCAQMTAEHVRAVVDHCLNRCRHYGITRSYDMMRYLNLMFVFGFAFDAELPWAANALAFPNPDGRVDLLMDRALRQKAAAGGTRGKTA